MEASGDYTVDEKSKTVTLTEAGIGKAERLLAHRLLPGGLYDPANMPLLHHVQQGLRAHTHYRLDVEYMIKDGQVVIVDEFTGRLMPGRRWSDGLHQAVEAKEGVKIERENQTLATITFQNYFRKYGKLSGMTGTAETEAPEFNKIYKLDVMVIPTNKPMLRIEEPDLVYRTAAEKYDAIVADIIEKQEAGRPVLVGTVSIEKSEKISGMLKRRGIKHVVLNAKYHAQEAEIVAQAGRTGRRDHRHQHGRPRHRHPARRQPRVHGPPAGAERRSRPEARTGRGAVRRRRRVRLFLARRQLPGAARRLGSHLRPFQGPVRGRAQGGRRPRRAAHPRHRAARGPAHRQPAARPRRPPGRPRQLALLPVARRRPDAHLRLRPHLRADAAAGHGRRRADRARHGHAGDRAGPEAGRGPELRRPQTPARVRRRDEQAA